MSEDQQGQNQQDQGGGLLGGVTEQVGQVAQGAQDTAGQAVDQASQAAEGLAPGTELLSELQTKPARPCSAQ